MRVTETSGPLSVHGIAGSYVVTFGIDVDADVMPGLLGFGIERTDHTENERYWLQGIKTFKQTDPTAGAGGLVSTREHPVQGFLWADFTAKPDHDYTYRVVALGGRPKALEEAHSASVRLRTESESAGRHSVWFNRGVAGSQAYARRFRNLPPDKVGDAAWKWLSRGLQEAMLAFIKRANGDRYALRAAVYEFQYEPALAAFGNAAKSGADVKVIFDCRANSKDYPRSKNLEAIRGADIGDICIKRTHNASYISHNKFIVLLEKKRGRYAPIEVWTGSTNLTAGGIFGQSNVGHVVRDPDVAQKYLEYWQRLSEDPDASELREWTDEATPVPEALPSENSTSCVFSPRGSIQALEWYSTRMDEAKTAVMFTAAFGVNDYFMKVLETDKPYLRYALLEKDTGDMEAVRRDPDNRISVGSVLAKGGFERWLRERLTGLNEHVKYVHTKYMLIDPLSDDPLVISGSANFSDASTRKNDENMLIIRGDTRVADIYLGEFMRMFKHFEFRALATGAEDPDDERLTDRHLATNDSWWKPYYRRDSAKFKEREYFRARAPRGNPAAEAPDVGVAGARQREATSGEAPASGSKRTAKSHKTAHQSSRVAKKKPTGKSTSGPARKRQRSK